MGRVDALPSFTKLYEQIMGSNSSPTYQKGQSPAISGYSSWARLQAEVDKGANGIGCLLFLIRIADEHIEAHLLSPLPERQLDRSWQIVQLFHVLSRHNLCRGSMVKVEKYMGQKLMLR